MHDAHVLPALVEHGRRVVVPTREGGVVGAGTAAAQYGALRETGRDVRLDLRQMPGGDQRPGLGVGVEGAAEADAPGAADHLVDEAVVQRVLDDQPGAGRTDLPGMQEDGREGEIHGRLEVGVGEHDVRVLAAEFQRDLLHRRGGGRHDASAGLQAAGEGDHVHRRVLGQGCARFGAGAQDEVGGTGRESRLRQRLHQQDRGGGGEFAGLQDDRVAGEEGRGDLPTGLQEGVVPGCDEAADADRFINDATHGVLAAGVDHPSGVGAAESAVVAEAGDDVGHVVRALHQPLAGVQRLGAGELLGVPFDEVGRAQQQRAALPLGGARPGSLVEGGARRGDGRLGVGAGPFRDGRDQGAVSRAADLPALAGHRVPPFAGHIQVCHAPSPSAGMRCASCIQLLVVEHPCECRRATSRVGG